ncbi:MAG: histidine phosphatase family protein, partial [Gammaproteobacteria bacterium]|nr:histidine phosphatase family protein [Gammaproteobacteria bacterium]
PGAFEIRTGGTSRRPLVELNERASGFLEEEVLGTSSSILAVSHLGANQALINVALGLSEDHHHRLQQSQCGISRLVFDDAGRARLTLLNDTSVLGEALPKIKSRKAGVRVVLLGLGERCVPGRTADGAETRRDRSVWTENGLDFPAEWFPGAKAFSLVDGAPDDALAGTIRCLRARDDRLSTVVVAVRPASLPGVARHLFGIPEALLAGVGNAPVFRMVIHDSARHGRPIVQAIDAESDRFCLDGGAG